MAKILVSIDLPRQQLEADPVLLVLQHFLENDMLHMLPRQFKLLLEAETAANNSTA